MKQILIIAIVLITINTSNFAQKIELNANVGLNNYSNVNGLFKQDIEYNNNINNSGSEVGIYINYFPKETYYLSLGFKSSTFQNIITENNVTFKTFDEVLKIPLKYYMRTKLSEKIYWDIGLGVYSGILIKQNKVLPDNSYTTYGFASYSNIGISSSNYLVFCPKERIGFKMGINVDYDIYNIYKKTDNVIDNSFNIFSMDFGLFVKF